MGNNPTQDETRTLRGLDDLLEPFFAACKPPTEFRIGAEAEKIGLVEGTHAPVQYEGELGVVAVMRELAATHGWRVVDDEPLLSLEKNGASVTLEPGAQLELSGAPLADAHLIRAEFDEHLAELDAVSASLRARHGTGIEWYGVGFHPFASQAELAWVPKPRYGVMRRYLPAIGRNGLDMMRRTATVQANFDYESEEHAMRSLRVGLRSAPFFSALFANAPFLEGRVWTGKSVRADVWLDVDRARQGLVPGVLKEGSRFVDYVEWALDAPMFLILREGVVHENTGQSFRSFLRHGFGALRATMADWVTHLNTLFPEVRLKRTLEVRGGDSLPSALVVAPAALYAGLLYDPTALARADDLLASFTYEELTELRAHVPTLALRAPWRGGRAVDVAQTLIEIATEGLERRGRRRDGRSEAVHLAPLVRLAEKALSPADLLLEGAGPESTREAVFAALQGARLLASGR